MRYNCKRINIPKNAAGAYLEQYCRKYEYALVYMISKLILCRSDELNIEDWEECLEARFFSEQGEFHYFDLDGEKSAVEIEDTEEDGSVNIKRYEIANNFNKSGKILVVQEYLSYDGSF